MQPSRKLERVDGDDPGGWAGEDGVCSLTVPAPRRSWKLAARMGETVFLPTSDARIMTRILRLMREVTVVLPDGRVVVPGSALKAAA